MTATAATTLLALNPTATKVPDATNTEEDSILCLVSLSPMNLFPPPLNPPFLSTTAAYSCVNARALALNFTNMIQPLLIWIRGCLLDAAPGIASMDTLDLEDHLTGERINTLRDIFPEAPP